MLSKRSKVYCLVWYKFMLSSRSKVYCLFCYKFVLSSRSKVYCLVWYKFMLSSGSKLANTYLKHLHVFFSLGFMYTLYMQADGAGSAGLRNIPTSKCTFVCTVHKNKTLLDNSHSHFYFFKAGNQFNLKIFNFVNNISFRIVTSWHENYQRAH